MGVLRQPAAARTFTATAPGSKPSDYGDLSPLTTRREFLAVASGGVVALAIPGLVAAADATTAGTDGRMAVDDAHGVAGRAQAPVFATAALTEPQLAAAAAGRLQVREQVAAGEFGPPVPVQLVGAVVHGQPARLCWLLPPGRVGRRVFQFEDAGAPLPAAMHAGPDATGQYEIREAARPVLRYNYQTVEPGELLKSIAPGNHIYARPRSDYIHPLCGLDGETLTKDWSVDHPHHRGIYWAWPEVDWHGQRGDLHALQRVFARPTGKCTVVSGPVFAQLEGESLWKWEDRDAIVRERAQLRAYRSTEQGRLIDLEYEFTALGDEVSVARRGTNAYGGLNIRGSAVRDQKVGIHTDADGASPRMAWSELSGVFEGGTQPSGLVVLQHPGNPHYPGDWVQYPNLNWLQPTFPAPGKRHVIAKDQPLVLRFRLWLHRGPAAMDDTARDQWRAYQENGCPTASDNNVG
jgi:hypothetical protein